MKNMKKILTFLTASCATLILTACASNPTNSLAIQKENNQFEVTGVGKSALIAKNNAVSAANSSCGKSASPVLVDEKAEYNGALKGVVDEKTGQMIQAAAGVIGTLAGKSTGLSGDQDYQSTLTFYCKAK